VLALTIGDAQPAGASTAPADDADTAADAADTSEEAEVADSTVATEAAEPSADSSDAAEPPEAAASSDLSDAVPLRVARAPHWGAFGRAAFGAAIPVVVVAAFFIAAGAWSDLVGAAVEFPATGVEPPQRTFLDQVSSIFSVVHGQYRFSATLFWAGTVIVVVFVVAAFVRNHRAPLDALRDPVVSVVGFAWILQVGYMLYDFEGGPDVFPLLPAPAVCLGGLFAMVVNEFRGNGRRLAACVTLVAAVALAAGSWARFSTRGGHGLDPNTELADACGLQRTLAGTRGLWVMGDPVPLVLTGRTNPDRFIYLGEGVDEWKVTHTVGGFNGWMAQIAAARPSAVLINDWGGTLQVDTATWLKTHGYRRYFIGTWKIFLVPGVRTTALARGVQITQRPTDYAIDENGNELSTRCRIPRVG
jgi:hypothetical protein